MKELGITKGEVKPEFTIEQIRAFVAKNYNSVSARYVKSALQHYDELLQQRDELKEALAEQKRIYFNLFEEEVRCMYCEAKINRGSAIILCKECAENTEA